jgi:hypothetical protein
MSVEPILYTTNIANIEIIIIYSPYFTLYQLIIRKNKEIYTPHESTLKAHTWETLCQMIETEIRSEPLQLFIGVQSSKKVSQAILACQPVFSKCP